MKKRELVVSGVLIISLLLNILTGYKLREERRVWNLSFENANSWETYFSVHRVRGAQKRAKGKGIKVGILDHYFGTKKHGELYAGEKDFLGKLKDHQEISEHGYWLTNTLKEIAPECQVYALSTLDSKNETKRVKAMAEAIDWAIENKLDILTYSAQQIEDSENKKVLDAAVEKAEANGIIITFIHYDHPYNMKPIGIYEEDNKENIESTITIYSYDYNLLLKSDFNQYGMGNIGAEEARRLFYSNSSMSVVVAGFMAILKSIDPTLTPKEYREILMASAQERTVMEPQTLRQIPLKHVADIEQAVNQMESKIKY